MRLGRFLKWAGLAVCGLTLMAWAASGQFTAWYNGRGLIGVGLARYAFIVGIPSAAASREGYFLWNSQQTIPPEAHWLPLVSRTSGGSAVFIPFWLVLAVAGSVAALGCRRQGRRRPQAGRCPGCNYDLRGNTSGRCPECGRGIG